MALSWTEITNDNIILTSVFQELLENMDSLATYMDTKDGNTTIYNALPIHKNSVRKRDIISSQDILYSAADTLDNYKKCVAVLDSYKVTYKETLNTTIQATNNSTIKNSCYGYTSTANTSVDTTKNTGARTSMNRSVCTGQT